jgi:hypothetical protein
LEDNKPNQEQVFGLSIYLLSGQIEKSGKQKQFGSFCTLLVFKKELNIV